MRYIITILLVFLLNACVPYQVDRVEDTNQSDKTLIIDIDQELELLNATGLRDEALQVVEEPIYIGDNDEVSFRGEELKKRSPLRIQVGDKKEIEFNGDRYTIKTTEIKDGDEIRIKDSNGEIFVSVRVIKH